MAFDSILGGESGKTFEKSCGNSCEKGHASKDGASFQYIVIIDEFSKIDFSTPLWFPSEILMTFNSILGGESRKTFEKSCGNSCEKGHASKHGPLFNTL